MDNNQFDEQIKASMQHLEMPYHADHWQHMEASLNDLEKQGDASAEDAFDAFISGKLENISASIQLPDWDRMEAALEKAGMPDDQLFDKEVKSKVARIQPVYQSSHWELLAERLRREKAIKESLFKNKMAELVIFALLLLNFYQYIPNHHAVNSLPIITQPIQETPKESTPSPISIPTTEAITPVPLAQTNKKEISGKTTVAKSTPVVNTKVTHITPITDNQLFISPALSTIAVSGVSSQPDLQQVIFGIDGKTGLTITVPEMTRHLDYLGLSNSAFVETIPSLAPASLATATVPLGCEKCKKPKIPAKFRFGMVAHVGATSAPRSPNQLLSIAGLVQKGNGYGSGFVLGFKYRDFEIETGAIYASKSYAPNIDDPYKQGDIVRLKQFKRINLQTLRIPATFRYNYAVFGRGKWHLYLQGGVAFNMVMIADYDIPDKPQASNKSFADSEIAASSRLARINYNQGVFGGDRFNENRFLTFSVGPVAAEYYLSPKWSVFLQPEFDYYISSHRIGPTQDRINSLSVSFGIKASFH